MGSVTANLFNTDIYSRATFFVYWKRYNRLMLLASNSLLRGKYALKSLKKSLSCL